MEQNPFRPFSSTARKIKRLIISVSNVCDTFNRQTYFLQGFVPASKSALKKWTKIFHQEMKKKEKAGEKEV